MSPVAANKPLGCVRRAGGGCNQLGIENGNGKNSTSSIIIDTNILKPPATVSRVASLISSKRAGKMHICLICKVAVWKVLLAVSLSVMTHLPRNEGGGRLLTGRNGGNGEVKMNFHIIPFPMTDLFGSLGGISTMYIFSLVFPS